MVQSLPTKKIDVERLNTVYGCIAGQTGVDIKTGVTLNPMGPFGCECETKKNCKILGNLK